VVLLLLCGARTARGRGAPQRLALLQTFLHDANPPYTQQELERYEEALSQPGAAAGMINYYRASARQSQKEAAAKLRPISAPTLVIWGSAIPTSAQTSPSPTATTYPTSTAWSACATRRTGRITMRLNASTDRSSTASLPWYRSQNSVTGSRRTTAPRGSPTSWPCLPRHRVSREGAVCVQAAAAGVGQCVRRSPDGSA
jgi:hypothetical protein